VHAPAGARTAQCASGTTAGVRSRRVGTAPPTRLVHVHHSSALQVPSRPVPSPPRLSTPREYATPEPARWPGGGAAGAVGWVWGRLGACEAKRGTAVAPGGPRQAGGSGGKRVGGNWIG